MMEIVIYMKDLELKKFYNFIDILYALVYNIIKQHYE